jgi:hypothetical protein
LFAGGDHAENLLHFEALVGHDGSEWLLQIRPGDGNRMLTRTGVRQGGRLTAR